jgi:hypothetical protein
MYNQAGTGKSKMAASKLEIGFNRYEGKFREIQFLVQVNSGGSKPVEP